MLVSNIFPVSRFKFVFLFLSNRLYVPSWGMAMYFCLKSHNMVLKHSICSLCWDSHRFTRNSDTAILTLQKGTAVLQSNINPTVKIKLLDTNWECWPRGKQLPVPDLPLPAPKLREFMQEDIVNGLQEAPPANKPNHTTPNQPSDKGFWISAE